MAFARPPQAPLARFEGSREGSADQRQGQFDGLDRIQTERTTGPIHASDLDGASPLARFLLFRTPDVDVDLSSGLAGVIEDVDLSGCDDVG